MADVTARTPRSRESSNERGIPQAGSSSELRDGDFEMFDTLREAKHHTEFLTTARVNFIGKFFCEVVPDETIDSTVLENCLVPDFHALVLKKLGTDILDLIPAQAQKAVRQKNGWYISIGKRIKYSLVPLSQPWKVLSNARQSVQDQSSHSNSDVDINKVLWLVEQRVVCLGRVPSLLTFTDIRLFYPDLCVIPKSVKTSWCPSISCSRRSLRSFSAVTSTLPSAVVLRGTIV